VKVRLMVPPTARTGAEVLDLLSEPPVSAAQVPERLQHLLRLTRGAYERELGCTVSENWCPPSAAIVLVAAGVGEPDASRCAAFACGMEMVWQAVIQHRSAGLGRAPVESILSSDFVLSRALSIFILDGDAEVIRTVVDGAMALAQSVLAADAQEASADVVVDGIARYWGACCRVGAIAGGLPPWHAAKLEDVGRRAGSALRGGPASIRWEFAQTDRESELVRVLAGIAGAVHLAVV